MALTQGRGKRNARGSRYKSIKGYKKHELGRAPALTVLGKKRVQKINTLGGNTKLRLLHEEYANVMDPKTQKAKKSKIKNALENPANKHFVRRNIITKGSVIETELGKARVTSRPGQEGVINAVLIA